LHGNLNLEEQKEVLCSTPKGKIILATNVAESSLTINGVDTVIDTGLSRELINDPRKFYPLLKTSRTSKNSAEQRKGRAGRQFAGKCFRLWNKEDENAMPDHGIPDILKIDLIEASLFLLSINITNPCEFSWFDEKPNASIQKALQTLSSWGLLNSNGTLNSKGLRVSQLPLPPRLGCLIDAFSEAGLRILGCQIAALLLEKDPFFNQDLQSWEKLSNDSDLIPRLLELNEKKISGPFILIEKVAINLYLAVTPKSQALPYRKNLIFSTDTINNLLLSIFHDCLCRRRRINELAALTITGQGVELSTKSLVRQNEFFLALQGHSIEGDNHSIVGLASPVKKAKIIELFASEIETKTRIEMQNGKFFKIQQKFFKKLPLEDEQKISCKTEDIPLRESFIAYWTEFKKSNKEITQWILRLNWAKKIFNKIDWKNLEDNDFDSKAIDIALMGETNFQDILNKNWENTLNLLLTNEQYKIIKNEFPVFLISTRGKRIPLEYEYNQVNAELKIQDAFGWKETPRIANGEIAIRLILLGPHSRPLQTTADLASFWQNTYQQLRGGLKAKYPKHPWPEQPWIKIL
jgi:ATP-dependent helicase HrpB